MDLPDCCSAAGQRRAAPSPNAVQRLPGKSTKLFPWVLREATNPNWARRMSGVPIRVLKITNLWSAVRRQQAVVIVVEHSGRSDHGLADGGRRFHLVRQLPAIRRQQA